jgi:hypothetical protein
MTPCVLKDGPINFVIGNNVHRFPQIREALLREVKDAAPSVWVRQCGRIGPLHKRVADGKAIALDMLSSGFRRSRKSPASR